MRRNLIASGVALFMLSAQAGAVETQTILWKDVGPWTIRIVEDGQNFCEASAYWPGGTHMTLGFAANRQAPRMVVSNPDWLVQKNSKGYELIVQFGRQMPWRVPSHNPFNSESNVELQIEARDLLFFEEMMGAKNFGVRFGDQSVVQFEMNGAYDALLELRSCQLNVAGQAGITTAGAS